MPTLTITFQDMFLYVRREGKPDAVLLPSGADSDRHIATIDGPGIEDPGLPVPTEISFHTRSGGKLVSLSGKGKNFRPSHHRLTKLNEVLGEAHNKKVYVPSYRLDEDLGQETNARVVLPIASSYAWNARYPGARGARWTFNNGDRVELTDRMVTTVEIEDVPVFVRRVSFHPDGIKATNDDELEKVGGHYRVTVSNEDLYPAMLKCKASEIPHGPYELEQYRLLYALTNLTPADIKASPIPNGDYGSSQAAFDPSTQRRAKCLPICGGADCPEG